MSYTTEEKDAIQRPRRKRGKKLAILIVLLVILAAAAAGVYHLFFAKEEKTAVTGTTTYGSLNEAIEGSGTTVPADSISYTVNGTVKEWHVEAGDEVEAGDLLYVLDASEAEDQILEYEVELEDLYEELEELQDNIANQWVTAPFSGRIEKVQAEEGKNVQNGTNLATLVDSSCMEATLYFSYAYEKSIQTGMEAVVSVPDQMLNLTGTVSEIHYVDYVTPVGMRCFAVTIQMENPGALTEGTSVTCWIETEEGVPAYAVDDTTLRYHRTETITADASGELTAVNVVNYQRVAKGEKLFVIDTSSYEKQLETLQKQIESYEEKIADLKESIATEYTRYADISGRVVNASYSTNRMTGKDSGTVTIYNQDTMQISINVDELDADYLEKGMEVYVYRTTSSSTVSYPATLSYLSLEATSGGSGVSTFAATITIESDGKLSSGVTVYYAITPGSGEGAEGVQETVLAPINALFRYDDGYYMLIQADKEPENTIDPAERGGSVTEYPEGYYAVPVEVGDYNGSYIQILSGVEQGATVFLRYMNAAPGGGDTTSNVGGDNDTMSNMPGMGNMGGMSGFGDMGNMGNMGGQGGNMGGQGGNMGGNRGSR